MGLQHPFGRTIGLEISLFATNSLGYSDWSPRRTRSLVIGSSFHQAKLLQCGFSFNHHEKDQWTWSLSSNGRFAVKLLSGAIDEQILPNISIPIETLRNNLVPKKVEIFVWRALKRRLPVRMELDKKGIDLHSVRCPICDDDMETVEHSLIFCKHSLDLWNRVFEWWHLGNFSNLSINEILRGNSSTQMSNFGNKIWQAVEWVCAYYIWKNRNNKVFRDKCWNTPVALSEIQVKSFDWISNRSKGRNLEWLTWLSNPSVYLNI
ncbi:uncharacterized protein [Rutidosis leptorrhynchoides]|uniref:uncharacterized protein n=1 Tax=Rutidosis leptorrhynchoides TaxID=125765 RepID=UPI003A998701